MVTITKLYLLWSRFWFLLQFLLRGLTWAVLHVWTQNYPQNVGTCPGLPLQLLARNFFSKVRGLNAPYIKRYVSRMTRTEKNSKFFWKPLFSMFHDILFILSPKSIFSVFRNPYLVKISDIHKHNLSNIIF